MAFVEHGSHLSKGPLCYFLDKLSRQEDSLASLSALRKAIMELEPRGYQGFIQVFTEHVFNKFDIISEHQKAILDYLNDYWFNETSGWWPQLQPIEPVFCTGLIKVLDLSIGDTPERDRGTAKKALPIDSYWIIIDDCIEMAAALSPEQVNLFIMTPAPPRPRVHGVWSPDDTKIWLIKDDRLGGEQVSLDSWKRPGGSRGKIVTVRVKKPGSS